MSLGKYLPWVKTYEIDCPGGHKVIIFKNISDAIPFDTKNSSGSFKLSAEAAEIGKIGLTAGQKSQIEGLLFAIDDRNSSHQMEFRAAYTAFLTNPCEKSDYLQRAQERLVEGRQRLEEQAIRARTFLSAIQHAPEQADRLIAQVASLFQDFHLPAPAAAVAAIEDAKKSAKKIIGEEGG